MFKNLNLKSASGFSKPLKELTDQEIERVICNNEKEPSGVLACVCAEYLRRQIEKQRKDND